MKLNPIFLRFLVMGKKRLIVSYEIDFDLYGLIATIKDYKLAWLLNKALKINMVRQPDINMDFISGGRLVLCNYLYSTEHLSIRMVKNKDVEQSQSTNYLIPEMSNFDFIFQVDGLENLVLEDDFEKKVKSIPEVEYFTRIDISKLKSKENLIFD